MTQIAVQKLRQPVMKDPPSSTVSSETSGVSFMDLITGTARAQDKTADTTQKEEGESSKDTAPKEQESSSVSKKKSTEKAAAKSGETAAASSEKGAEDALESAVIGAMLGQNAEAPESGDAGSQEKAQDIQEVPVQTVTDESSLKDPTLETMETVAVSENIDAGRQENIGEATASSVSNLNANEAGEAGIEKEEENTVGTGTHAALAAAAEDSGAQEEPSDLQASGKSAQAVDGRKNSKEEGIRKDPASGEAIVSAPGAGTQKSEKTGDREKNKPDGGAREEENAGFLTNAGIQQAAESGGKIQDSGAAKTVLHRAGTEQTQNAFEGSEPETGILATGKDALPTDLAGYLTKLNLSDGKQFRITLQPENLGRIELTVHRVAETTILSISAASADTLKILSTHAQEMGQIITENTGEETTVQVSEPQQEQARSGTNPDADSGGRQSMEQEQEERHRQGRQQKEAESFLDRMRLGLI